MIINEFRNIDRSNRAGSLPLTRHACNFGGMWGHFSILYNYSYTAIRQGKFHVQCRIIKISAWFNNDHLGVTEKQLWCPTLNGLKKMLRINFRQSQAVLWKRSSPSDSNQCG